MLPPWLPDSEAIPLPATLIFDLETIPDLPRLRAAGADLPAADAAAYAALAAAERPPKPAFCHVVAISAAWIDPDGRLAACGPFGTVTDSEPTLLRQWFTVVGTRRPRLVGWNSRGFDVPVLLTRALVHGVVATGFYQADGYRRRYDETGHLDLMDVLSGYGAAARLALHELAVACGFPGKGDVRGTDVGDLWQAGDLARIRQYCTRDVLTTALLYGRYATHRGWWDAAQADRFEASVRAWLADQADPDWAAFAAAWDPAAHVAGPEPAWAGSAPSGR